jgi:hypothetical protein
MPRAPRRSYAILWLLVIHVLADVAVGVYRAQDVNRELTDVVSAALGRGQICLLATWLALGADPLSWRLCGFIGGASFVFVIFTRTALPGQHGAGAGAVWLEEEWAHYFRLSGPGDLLLKAPVLIALVAGPLVAFRLWRWLRRRVPAEPIGQTSEGGKRRRMQFGLGEASLWVITLSVTFAAIFRTAPYPEWLAQLATRWRDWWRISDAPAVYAIGSGAVYAAGALASLWLVYGRSRLSLRLPLFLVLSLGPAYACEKWLESITAKDPKIGLSTVWGQASAEIWISAAAAMISVASIILYRLYGREAHVRPGPVRLQPPRGADRPASAPGPR